jgi:putative SOS response-associated peptidase YedK
MCGRYVRKSGNQEIAEHSAVHGPSLPDFGPSWNVAPQTFQPIVRLNRDTGEREIVMMRWGLIPTGLRTRVSACPQSMQRTRRSQQHQHSVWR